MKRSLLSCILALAVAVAIEQFKAYCYTKIGAEIGTLTIGRNLIFIVRVAITGIQTKVGIVACAYLFII